MKTAPLVRQQRVLPVPQQAPTEEERLVLQRALPREADPPSELATLQAGGEPSLPAEQVEERPEAERSPQTPLRRQCRSPLAASRRSSSSPQSPSGRLPPSSPSLAHGACRAADVPRIAPASFGSKTSKHGPPVDRVDDTGVLLG